MRLLVYILTIGILLISTQLRGQDINSYDVNAILNVDSNSIEINQIMKFKNTSNIELKDKFTLTNDDSIPVDNAMNKDHQDAYNALLTLGYKSIDIQKKINKHTTLKPEITTEELIKICLKDLK